MLPILFSATILFTGEAILGHLKEETFVDILISLVAVFLMHYVIQYIPESFNKPLPTIIITLSGLFGTFFLVKPLYNKSIFPHDLKEFTLP